MKKKLVKKKPIVTAAADDDDSGEFINSDDEEYSSSGGDMDREPGPNELDDDSSTLDVDPDDEKDPNEDGTYDPINEFDEPVDTDEEVAESEKTDEEITEEEDIEVAAEEEGAKPETKACYMKNLNKDFVVMDEDDSSMYGKMEYTKIPNGERISDSILTYYELVRIIGTRAQQFNFGAEPLVKGVEGLHPAKIAYIELISKMTPYIIKRYLPGKKYEEWKISELENIHKITDDFFLPENFDLKSIEQSRINRSGSKSRKVSKSK